jgi:hypothetical protein
MQPYDNLFDAMVSRFNDPENRDIPVTSTPTELLEPDQESGTLFFVYLGD